MKECLITTRVDSIRPKSTLGLPTPPPPPPDSETPPVFPPNPLPMASTTTGVPNATSTIATNSPPTANTMADADGTKDAPLVIQDVPLAPTDSTVTSVDSSEAVALLWNAVKICFISAPSTFVNEHVYNKKAQKMAALTAESQLKKHANKTLEILTTDGSPSGKVAAIAEDVVKQRVNAATKRKLNADADSWEAKFKELSEKNAKMEQKMQHEKSKRIKLENKFKALDKTTDESKESRRPAKGANQKNQAGKNRSAHKHIPKSTVASHVNQEPPEAEDANSDTEEKPRKRSRPRSVQWFQKSKNKVWTKPKTK